LPLELIGLSKAFTAEKNEETIQVLQEIDYRIEDGQFVSILGPSGCGKTTLLRIIAGLEKPSAGNVLLNKEEIITPVEKIGFVFQEYALFSWRTTRKNIEFGLELRGIDKKTRRTAALEYIETFGLTGFENRYPRELSGGMQQRVAIARTLINDPEVILMDEPFGSLDSQTRNSMQEFLLGIWRKRRETVLFVTHNVDEAVFLSDKILVFGRRPARIIKVFDVECPRPRDRTSPECNQTRREVLSFLADEKREYNGVRLKLFQ